MTRSVREGWLEDQTVVGMVTRSPDEVHRRREMASAGRYRWRLGLTSDEWLRTEDNGDRDYFEIVHRTGKGTSGWHLIINMANSRNPDSGIDETAAPTFCTWILLRSGKPASWSRAVRASSARGFAKAGSWRATEHALIVIRLTGYLMQEDSLLSKFSLLPSVFIICQISF
jgi:hypothetical protein